jgi:hypothetical protein
MPSARDWFFGMIIDLLVAVLEKIAFFYVGDQSHTPEEERILEAIKNFRDTLSYYTVPRTTYGKAGKERSRSPDVKAGRKRPRSTRGSGGYARNPSDNDDEASDDNDKAGARSSVVKREMCTVCNKEICPVCGECHGDKERSSPSADCVEVEVVEESPVAVTISSSPGDDYASGNNDGLKNDSDSSGVSAAALRLYRSAVEAENTGDADAGPKEGRVPRSSSSDDDGGE